MSAPNVINWQLHGASPPDFLSRPEEHWFGIVSHEVTGTQVSAVKHANGELVVMCNWKDPRPAARLWYVRLPEIDTRMELTLRITVVGEIVELRVNGAVVAPYDPAGL